MNAFMEALRNSGMMFIIVIGAILFSYFMAASGIAQMIANLVESLPFTNGHFVFSRRILYFRGLCF